MIEERKEEYVEHVIAGLVIEVTAEVLSHGDFHENGLEKILEALRSVFECANALHDVFGKQAERVALGYHFLVAQTGLGNGELQNHDDVVDHELITMHYNSRIFNAIIA